MNAAFNDRVGIVQDSSYGSYQFILDIKNLTIQYISCLILIGQLDLTSQNFTSQYIQQLLIIIYQQFIDIHCFIMKNSVENDFISQTIWLQFTYLHIHNSQSENTTSYIQEILNAFLLEKKKRKLQHMVSFQTNKINQCQILLLQYFKNIECK